MLRRVQEYLEKRRWEKYFKRKEQMAEVLRNTPRPDREKLKEESRLFMQYISEKQAARRDEEKIHSTTEQVIVTPLDVLKKHREQGLQHPMEMEEINSFIEETRKQKSRGM